MKVQRQSESCIRELLSLLGIHMELVKWFALDFFRMWTNGMESVSAVVLSWRNTTLM